MLARCGVPVPCALCLCHIIHTIKGCGPSPQRGNALPSKRKHTFASFLLKTHHSQPRPVEWLPPQNRLPLSPRKRVLFSTHQDAIPHRSLKGFGSQNNSQNGSKIITKPSWNPDRIRTPFFSLSGTPNGAHNIENVNITYVKQAFPQIDPFAFERRCGTKKSPKTTPTPLQNPSKKHTENT